MCACGKETPKLFLVRAFLWLVSRRSTGDGCLFLLEPRASDSKPIKIKLMTHVQLRLVMCTGHAVLCTRLVHVETALWTLTSGALLLAQVASNGAGLYCFARLAVGLGLMLAVWLQMAATAEFLGCPAAGLPGNLEKASSSRP